MNNITAVIGLEQMKYIEKIASAHIKNAKLYDQEIVNPKITKLQRQSNSESSCWIYSILCETRDDLQKHLQENGIQSDVVHVRNDNYSIFKSFKRHDLDNLDYFNNNLLNIPVGWWLSKKELWHILNCVNNY